MKKSNENQTFLDNINDKLDQGVNEIDDATVGALHNIRKAAIAQAENKTINTWNWLQPIPVMAMASIVLVVSVTLQMTMTSSVLPAPALADIPLLTASDDIEFYNDLEFYQWLDAEKLNG